MDPVNLRRGRPGPYESLDAEGSAFCVTALAWAGENCGAAGLARPAQRIVEPADVAVHPGDIMKVLGAATMCSMGRIVRDAGGASALAGRLQCERGSEGNSSRPLRA